MIKAHAGVASYLKENSLDALLVSNFYNIRYLTGFKTLSPQEREAFLLVGRREMHLFTDGRYSGGNAYPAYHMCLLTPEQNLPTRLQETAKQKGYASIGFEREDLKWSEYEMFRSRLGVTLVPVDRLVLKMRSVKTAGEIAAIREACRIGDECLSLAASAIKPGMTEKQIAWEMEKFVRENGAEFSFDPIVAVDGNAAIPHYDTKSGQGKVKNGSVVLIDMGVKHNDYCSDITRMFFVGSIDTEKQKAYSLLLRTQEATIAKLKEGGSLRDADLFCRQTLQEAGYSAYPHSTGHGVGLEVHEYPKMSSVSTEHITPGQAVTVEPGIYIPGKWGMRIEDTVAIGRDGEAFILTAFPKQVQIV